MTKTTTEVGDLLSVLGAHGFSLRREALPGLICGKANLPSPGPKDLTGQLTHALDVSNSAQSLRRHWRSFIGADAPFLFFLAGDANEPNRRQH